MTPIDEAKGSVELISKRFYARTLFRELGMTNSKTTKTSENYNKINRETQKYSDDLLRYFGIFVSKDNKRVPSIYWLPAIHKNSTKARFIIMALACSANPLPKYVTSVFELL